MGRRDPEEVLDTDTDLVDDVDAVMERVGRAERDSPGERDEDGERDGDGDVDASASEADTDADMDKDPVGDADPDCEFDSEGVLELLTEPVAVMVCVRVTVAVELCDADTAEDRERVRVRLGEPDGVREPAEERELDGEADDEAPCTTAGNRATSRNNNTRRPGGPAPQSATPRRGCEGMVTTNEARKE